MDHIFSNFKMTLKYNHPLPPDTYINPFSPSVGTNRGYKTHLSTGITQWFNNLADNYIVTISFLQRKAL